MPPLVRKQVGGKVPAAKKPTSKASIWDRAGSIEFDDTEGIKILLYGKSGTGKTTLAGSFPGRSLWLVASGGEKPGELRSLDTPENRDRIRQRVLPASAEIYEWVDALRADRRYDNVVLDHVSGLQDMTLRETLGWDKLPAQKSWGMTSQQVYGESTAACKELLRAVLSLPMNVIIVAQERSFNDEDGGSHAIAPTVGAAVTPSLAGWLNPAVDYVCNTFIREKTVEKEVVIREPGKAPVKRMTTTTLDEVEYCLRVAPDPVYMTKFRQPRGAKMPKVVVDPNHAKLMALIRGQSV